MATLSVSMVAVKRRTPRATAAWASRVMSSVASP